MPKILDCDRCILYAYNPHLVCGVHPEGVEDDSCIDFRANPNIETEEKWSPQGYSWYGGELIPNRPSKYTQAKHLEILDNHPFFTGICPQCQHQFDKANLPAIHWDCSSCGWVDDSV